MRRSGRIAGVLSVFLFVFGDVASPFAFAEPWTDEETATLVRALDDFVPAVLQHHGTPGLILSVARGGEIAYNRGFGYADVSGRVPMPPDAVFKGGSMGKTYTATAVLQLVDGGIIDLDRPVNEYLEQFQVSNPLGDREITVRDFLTHRSGLSPNVAGGAFFGTPTALEEHLVNAYRQSMSDVYHGTLTPRWTSKVGDEYQYSNLGIATLGYLVQELNPDKLSFSDYIREHIMEPLGMTAAQYPAVQDDRTIRADLVDRIPTGYADFAGFLTQAPSMSAPEYPAGNAIYTANDHIRLLLAYMNGGLYEDYQLLRPKTAAAAIRPQAEMGDDAIGYVWWVRDFGLQTESFGHPGAILFEWTNNFRAFPRLDLAYVVATNHFPMTSAPRYREAEMIERFIVGWAMDREENPSRKFSSWAWKTSYVAGLIYVEQLNMLHIHETVDDTMIQQLTSTAVPVTNRIVPASLFDETGFASGVRAGLKIPATYTEYQANYLRKDLPVARFELTIILDLLGKQIDLDSDSSSAVQN